MIIEGKYFTIKNVGKSDMDSILNVYRQCEDFLSLGPVAHASIQMVTTDLKTYSEESNMFCGIFINGDMVGIIDFALCNYNGNPKRAFISLLMISKNHRGKGIGRDVVAAIEAEMRRNTNVKFIYAAVQTNNRPAIIFWHKMGYSIVSNAELQSDSTITYRLEKAIK